MRRHPRLQATGITHLEQHTDNPDKQRLHMGFAQANSTSAEEISHEQMLVHEVFWRVTHELTELQITDVLAICAVAVAVTVKRRIAILKTVLWPDS